MADYITISFYAKITDRKALRKHLLYVADLKGIDTDEAWDDDTTEEDMISALADLDLGPTEALWRVGLDIHDQSVERYSSTK